VEGSESMAPSRAIDSEPSTQTGPPTSPRCRCAPASAEVGRRGTGEIAIRKDAPAPVCPTRNDSQRLATTCNAVCRPRAVPGTLSSTPPTGSVPHTRRGAN